MQGHDMAALVAAGRTLDRVMYMKNEVRSCALGC
jgi:hypothetical protein